MQEQSPIILTDIHEWIYAVPFLLIPCCVATRQRQVPQNHRPLIGVKGCFAIFSTVAASLREQKLVTLWTTCELHSRPCDDGGVLRRRHPPSGDWR
ncbi:hypothetical protein V5799_002677, partial [Amblyomma americanum]